jgi:hypothetical protein
MIKFIIVQEQDGNDEKLDFRYAQVFEMMRHIDDVYGNLPYSKNSIDLLKTKIITTRQIQEDF